MKKAILFLVIAAGSFTADAQSLKDLLYGGKLKLDSNAVIRKGDDLSSKIDTSTKKSVEPATLKAVITNADAAKGLTTEADTLTAGTDIIDSTHTAVKEKATPEKSNTKVWKDYTASLVSTLLTEVLPNKKIKKETYYIMIDYEIETNGAVGIVNVISTPENEFLQEQVKTRLTFEPPQLSPILDRAGKPQKVKRKHNFTITKE